MVTGLRIDEALHEVLQEVDLQHFRRQICVDLQLRKLDHFDHVKDKELSVIGISAPAIRRLRAAINEKKRHLRRNPDLALRTVSIDHQETFTQPSSSQENGATITKDKVTLLENLGEGTFAIVKRAYWHSPDGRRLDVAVKILRDPSPLVMEELQREASSLLKLQHANLIRLYGVVSDMPWMIFELCKGGSLLDRLRDKKKSPLLVTTLLDYCQQIAKGMTYLELKHCVHRDLATRNVLLSSDEKVVKICDFGLMRSLEENERLYIMSPQKRVPFAWCPPESLRRREFSHASDVWAMGVLMWEIFTFGEDPWVGCKGRDVLERVEAGDRLPKPKFCSSQIYELMSLCWKSNPDHRPKFKLLWGFIKEATLNTAEVREHHPAVSEETLDLCVGDKVLVIDNVGVMWFGQSERTRCFGTFLRSIVFVRSKTENRMDQGNSKISRPVAGSFIHTGHGDVRGGHSWGTPEKIDDIYLKNPVIGKPTNVGVPTIVPTVTSLNTTASHGGVGKVKPQLPSKPPAFNTSKQNDIGIPLSPRSADPFVDSVRLNRATAQNAPSSSLFFNDIRTAMPTHSTTPPMFTTTPATRVAPPPPTTQPVSSNAVPRPLSAVPRKSPELNVSGSRSANNTPPIITADQFMQKKTSVSANLERTLTVGPKAPNTSFGQVPQVAPVHKSSAPVGISHGSSILSELHKKIGNGDPSSSGVRFRPQTLPQETPVFVHSQMSTMKNGIQQSSGPDPFEVSSAIKNIVKKDRYSEVVEKKTSQPSISHVHSNLLPVLQHNQNNRSSSTPQLGFPVLTPTPAPLSSARLTSSPVPVAHPTPSVIRPSHHNDRTSLLLPSATLNTSSFAQPRPSSQILVPTPAPSSPRQPHISNGQPQPLVPSSNVVPRPTVSSSSTQSQQPAKSSVPSTQTSRPQQTETTVVRPQPSTTAKQEPTATVTSQRPASVVSSVLSSTYRPTAQADISSLLPAPSALFYGANTSTTTAPVNPPAQTKPATTASTTSVQRTASSVSSSSTLPPPTVVSAPSQSATLPTPQSARPSTSTPVLLPSQPLVPTPLYPSLASIATPIQSPVPSSSVAPPPYQPSQSLPLFSAQRSLGGYGGYTPGMGGYPTNQYSSGYPAYHQQVNVYPVLGYNGYSSFGSIPQPPSNRNSTVIHTPDVLNSFDPLAALATIASAPVVPNAATVSAPQSVQPSVSRSEEMEILYKEAFFTDHSRCDWMVGKCNGNVEEALKKLKIEYLMDTGITKDRAHAMNALEIKGWNLNAAAESILTM